MRSTISAESLPFTLPDRVKSRREGGPMKPSAPDGGRDLQAQDGGKSMAHRPTSQPAPRGCVFHGAGEGGWVPGARPPSASLEPACSCAGLLQPVLSATSNLSEPVALDQPSQQLFPGAPASTVNMQTSSPGAGCLTPPLFSRVKSMQKTPK